MRFLFVGSVFCRERFTRSQTAFGFHLAVDTLVLGSLFPLPGQQRTFTAKSSGHHHVYRNSASHGAARHAWRTMKKGAETVIRTQISTGTITHFPAAR